jgi:hypothetical protein
MRQTCSNPKQRNKSGPFSAGIASRVRGRARAVRPLLYSSAYPVTRNSALV